RFAEVAHRRAFASRASFGRYVVSKLADALTMSPAKLRVLRDEAVAVGPDHVVLRNERLPADVVVLATGVTTSSSGEWSARVIEAWDECGLATIGRDSEVLLLGSGLSALDVLASLDAHGFGGKVTMVSRRGLLPRPHADVPPSAPLSPEAIDGA